MCAPQWEGAAVPADAADTDWPRCTEGCNKAEGGLIHSIWGTLLSWLFLVDLEHVLVEFHYTYDYSYRYIDTEWWI